MDDADLAQAHIAARQQNVDLAIAAARQKAQALNGTSHRAIDVALTYLCDDCGDPIPAERLAKVPGTKRCVWCQAEAEVAGRG